jgi:hypothetical protein
VPYPLSLGQVQCSISPLYSLCVMMVHCLFFSFVGQFDYGCCSQAQEMISVINYLPCFGEWLITCPISTSCFSSVCLLMVHAEISSLLLPLSSVHFQQSRPFCCVLHYSLMCWFILGMAGGIPCDAWCSPVWCTECLTGRLGANSGSGHGSSQVFSV